MIRSFWWGMGQFCRSRRARWRGVRGLLVADYRRVLEPRHQGSRVVQWMTQCKACQSERQAERRAMREAA